MTLEELPQTVKERVPENKQQSFIEHFNRVFSDAIDLDGRTHEYAETKAYQAAYDAVNLEKSMERHQPLQTRFEKFVPFTKIDMVKREVTGIFTSEAPDKTGEICDYSSSKPFYQKWSDGFAKATDGQSLGNLREMHQLSAAGRITDLLFDDTNKRISGTAKVVDDNAWKKVVDFVYTGFSHGGQYEGGMKKEKGSDGNEYKRYTANPSEISLVDNPANPECIIELIRADGTIEMKKFGDKKDEITMTKDEVVELIKSTVIEMKKGDSEQILFDPATKPGYKSDDKEQAKAEGADGEVCATCKQPKAKCACEKRHDPGTKHTGWQDFEQSGKPFAGQEGSESPTSHRHGKAEGTGELEKKEKDSSSQKPYGEVEYADPGYQEDKKKRYPLDSEKHIRAANSYLGMPKNRKFYTKEQLASMEAKIVAAWKEKIDPAGPPSAEKVTRTVVTILAKVLQKKFNLDDAKLDKVFDASSDLSKGMNHVSRLAQLLLDLAWLTWSTQQEQQAEGDEDSPLPKSLQDDLSSIAETLVEMAGEETKELVNDLAEGKSPDEAIMYPSLPPVPFCRASMPDEETGLFKAMQDDKYEGYEQTQPCPCPCDKCTSGDCSECTNPFCAYVDCDDCPQHESQPQGFYFADADKYGGSLGSYGSSNLA